MELSWTLAVFFCGFISRHTQKYELNVITNEEKPLKTEKKPPIVFPRLLFLDKAGNEYLIWFASICCHSNYSTPDARRGRCGLIWWDFYVETAPPFSDVAFESEVWVTPPPLPAEIRKSSWKSSLLTFQCNRKCASAFMNLFLVASQILVA